MSLKIIDLKEKFKAEICTFEVSKLLREAGVKCDYSYLAYDNLGELNDGAWLEEITGAICYPVIDFTKAMLMLEDTTVKLDQDFGAYHKEDTGFYILACKDGTEDCQSIELNLVDAILKIWLKHKKDK